MGNEEQALVPVTCYTAAIDPVKMMFTSANEI